MQQTKYKNADMAESADALASGASGGNFVGVQVPSSAPPLQKTMTDVMVFCFALRYTDITASLPYPGHMRTRFNSKQDPAHPLTPALPGVYFCLFCERSLPQRPGGLLLKHNNLPPGGPADKEDTHMARLTAFYSRAGENYFAGGYRTIPIGNTARAARIIADASGSDLLEIRQKTPYSDIYIKNVPHRPSAI